MAEYVLENNILKVTVDSKGCEIRDVICKTDNTHRMWNANPEGWKRVAPVLFPLIGKYKDKYTIQEDSFEKDAFIIEGGQAGMVSLVKNEKPFVTVKFDTPVFGLWSCKSKNVPFVCIEPWYGRTDAIDFTGELKDREYSNHLDAGEVFEKSFSIFFN